MINEAIVAVFETAAQADMVVKELKAAGVREGAIAQHDQTSQRLETTTRTGNSTGLWGRMFGDHATQSDREVFDESVSNGGVVVSVSARQDEAREIMDIMLRGHPLELNEEAGAESAQTGNMAAAARSNGDQVLKLSEEQLVVGKRDIEQGMTRIRRYVVSTPVEEQVNLRTENVSIERHAVTGDTVIGEDAWADKTIEVTATGEEAVVGKTARVKEEVVIHKDVGQRTETVRDSLRREEIEIEKIAPDDIRKKAS